MVQMSEHGKVWMTEWVIWVSRVRYRYLDGPYGAQGMVWMSVWVKPLSRVRYGCLDRSDGV